MHQEQPIALDLTREDHILQVLPRPPLLTSQDQNWSAIHVQHHRQPAWETQETRQAQHMIIINHFNRATSAKRTLDGQTQQEQLRDGEVVIVPAGIPHRDRWDAEGEFTLLLLDPYRLARVAAESLDADHVELIPQFSKPDPLISQIGVALRTELELNATGSRLYADSAAMMLSAHLLRHYATCTYKLEHDHNGLPSYKLKQAVEYIRAHLAEEISLEAIAESVKMSQYHFGRLFKQSTGVSPYQYVIQCRVERAKELLLQGDLTIAEVALEIGFANQSHLTQYFKRVVGVTPRQFIKS